MDFNFTTGDRDDIQVEATKQYGIRLAAVAGYDYAAVTVTPALAREIAQALNAAADYVEGN